MLVEGKEKRILEKEDTGLGSIIITVTYCLCLYLYYLFPSAHREPSLLGWPLPSGYRRPAKLGDWVLPSPEAHWPKTEPRFRGAGP